MSYVIYKAVITLLNLRKEYFVGEPKIQISVKQIFLLSINSKLLPICECGTISKHLVGILNKMYRS